MAIVSCEHHKGMGLCPDCSAAMEAEASEKLFRRKLHVSREREELLGAAQVARKYGLQLAEAQLNKAAYDRALEIAVELYAPTRAR
jgi:hypothetical protein